jgi:hypothetical protein
LKIWEFFLFFWFFCWFLPCYSLIYHIMLITCKELSMAKKEMIEKLKIWESCWENRDFIFRLWEFIDSIITSCWSHSRNYQCQEGNNQKIEVFSIIFFFSWFFAHFTFLFVDLSHQPNHMQGIINGQEGNAQKIEDLRVFSFFLVFLLILPFSPIYWFNYHISLISLQQLSNLIHRNNQKSSFFLFFSVFFKIKSIILITITIRYASSHSHSIGIKQNTKKRKNRKNEN